MTYIPPERVAAWVDDIIGHDPAKVIEHETVTAARAFVENLFGTGVPGVVTIHDEIVLPADVPFHEAMATFMNPPEPPLWHELYANAIADGPAPGSAEWLRERQGEWKNPPRDPWEFPR